MSSFQVRPPSRPLTGRVTVPPDKSITHRAIIVSAISQGKTRLKKFAVNNDCLATLQALKRLGVRITANRRSIIIYGRGLRGLESAAGAICVNESGTTMRILSGVLAGQYFPTTLTAAKSLSRRPMLRVLVPLRMMGAKISSKSNPLIGLRIGVGRSLATKIRNAKIIEEYPPITVSGGNLKAITYKLPVASAQVKSAILLAGLYSNGTTRIVEPLKTRDHTERMLKLFKAKIKIKANAVSIEGGGELSSPAVIDIPGDISSAAFFILAASILPGSCLTIKSVGLNPTRMGAVRVLKRMGADIRIRKSKTTAAYGYEPSGDITVKASVLEGTRVNRQEMPFLIDEMPLLMVAASNAKGKTLFEGVEELRVKETDRINSMVNNLNKMGANIRVKQENTKVDIVVIGSKLLVGAKVSSFGDHRTAMSMIIAGLKARGRTVIDDIDCINKSFPGFLKLLKSLKQ